MILLALLYLCGTILQSGDTVLPEVVVARRLKVFLEDDLERLFPKDRWVRTVAHPTRLPAQARCAGGDAVAAAGAGKKGEAAGQVGGAGLPLPGYRFADLEPPKGEASCASSTG